MMRICCRLAQDIKGIEYRAGVPQDDELRDVAVTMIDAVGCLRTLAELARETGLTVEVED